MNKEKITNFFLLCKKNREIEDEDDQPGQKIFKYFAKQQPQQINGDNLENKLPVVKRKAQFFSYRDLSQTAKLF
jgi:hypothetical protein